MPLILKEGEFVLFGNEDYLLRLKKPIQLGLGRDNYAYNTYNGKDKSIIDRFACLDFAVYRNNNKTILALLSPNVSCCHKTGFQGRTMFNMLFIRQKNNLIVVKQNESYLITYTPHQGTKLLAKTFSVKITTDPHDVSRMHIQA